MSNAWQWALWSAPSLFLLNWAFVLLAAAAITWRRREGTWPPYAALTRLAGAIAANPRTRVRTLWIATQLLILDLLAPLAVLIVRSAQ